MNTLIILIEALLFVIALSIDAFVSSLAYGSNKIKIPFRSVIVINIVCSVILAISLLLGTFISTIIPVHLTCIISFIILFIIGIIKLFDGLIKIAITKYNINKRLKFNIFDLNFVLQIYAQPQKADVDQSKVLSITEAIYLAIALSIDGLAARFCSSN